MRLLLALLEFLVCLIMLPVFLFAILFKNQTALLWALKAKMIFYR